MTETKLQCPLHCTQIQRHKNICTWQPIEKKGCFLLWVKSIPVLSITRPKISQMFIELERNGSTSLRSYSCEYVLSINILFLYIRALIRNTQVPGV